MKFFLGSILSVILLRKVFMLTSYQCADDLEVNTCSLKSQELNNSIIHYVKKCKGNKKCIDIGSYGQCIKINQLLQDGKKCKINEECESNNCVNKKCTPFEDGQPCQTHNNCKTTSYCKDNICTPLIPAGSPCDYPKYEHHDCNFGLLCNYRSTNICTEMFSLPIGADTISEYLCTTGSMVNNKCALTKAINPTCISDPNDSNIEKCIIGYTSDEEDYQISINCNEGKCPLQFDASQMKEYIKVYKEQKGKMDENDIKKIRVSIMTKETLGGNKDVVEAYANLIYYYEIENSNNKDCVRDYFIQYIGAIQTKISTYIILLFCFLL